MPKSLAEKLCELANPLPTFKDAEIEQDIDFVKKTDFLQEKNVDEGEFVTANSTSSLRKKNALLLSDFDAKYQGRKVSRKSLKLNDIEISSVTPSSDSLHLSDDASDEDDVEEEDNDVETEDDDDLETEEDDDGEKEDDIERYEDDSDALHEDGILDQVEKKEKEPDLDFGEAEADILSKKRWKENQMKELERSKSVRCQVELWDKLLESRIQIQKGLVGGNKLPLEEHYECLLTTYKDALLTEQNAAKKGLMRLLNRLISLQDMVMNQNKDLKKLLDQKDQSKTSNHGHEGDEEITSEESDAANCESDGENDLQRLRSLKRKRSLPECEAHLANQRNKVVKYCKDAIKKWNEKTLMASGRTHQSFLSMEQSTLTQIENVLSDKHRLITRTQLRRSAFRRVGEAGPVDQDFSERQYDPDIFDDDDFYHQLLREVIERKTAGVTDSVALGRHWLELDRLRRKMKRSVDTKASKGRKIRYQVHSKLVNFMAPVNIGAMTDEAKDELYSSLFGKKSKESIISPDFNIFSSNTKS